MEMSFPGPPIFFTDLEVNPKNNLMPNLGNWLNGGYFRKFSLLLPFIKFVLEKYGEIVTITIVRCL